MKKVIVHSRVKKVIIHPFAFAVFPVLSLYVKNIGRGHLGEAIDIAIGILIFTGLFWLLVNHFVKDKRKSSVIVSVFFILFFSYGHAISAFSRVLEWMHLLDKAWFLVKGDPALVSWLAIGGVLFLAASYFAVKSASDLRQLTKVLNIVGLTLVVMVGVDFFVTGGFNTFLMPRIREVVARTGSNKNTYVGKFKVFFPIVAKSISDKAAINEFKSSWQINMSLENTNAVSGSWPDIYYIILDMYARADYLEEIYHYDSSEFLSFLTDKGFYVASKSRANYPYSTHSLASSLNLVYLDEIADQVGEMHRDFGPSIVMLKNSRLIQYLRNRGYTIVAFATGYEFTEIRDADVYMEPTGPRWYLTEFQSTLINATPLAIFPILRGTQDDAHRERVLYTLNHIAEATKIDSPTFVFAHVVAPHPPYVFGANGEPVQSKPHGAYTYDEYKEAYRNQVAHVNKRMQTVIKDILSQSPEPPIIIVQSDHGSCYGPYRLNIPERMSILNAYYFPEQDYEALYEDITPVNTFRIILNGYFGTDYELLEDKSYYSSKNCPYLFTDVTDEVLSGN